MQKSSSSNKQNNACIGLKELDSRFKKLNVDNNLSLLNFVQGELGNCGMVASISTLANNNDLLNKVVPTGQNFDINNSSKVVFNLYKLGKLHSVEVDKSFPTEFNKLKYCRSSNNNLIGPLLEKALVELHFGGNYQSAEGVPASFVLSSLSNNFFEEILFTNNKKILKFIEIIDHGLKSRSPMMVSFFNSFPKKNIAIYHYHSLLEASSNFKEFTLYDPHGKNIFIKKEELKKNNFKFEICYFENKIFGIPEIKTYVEFTDKWQVLKRSESIHIVDYNLLVEEDNTEILMNLNIKEHMVIVPKLFIIANNDKMTVIETSITFISVKNTIKTFKKRSLRANLRRGKYKIVVLMSAFNKLKSCEECRKYLENDGNKFLFRFAASKQCIIAKSLKKETKKVEKSLLKWSDTPKNVYCF